MGKGRDCRCCLTIYLPGKEKNILVCLKLQGINWKKIRKK